MRYGYFTLSSPVLQLSDKFLPLIKNYLGLPGRVSCWVAVILHHPKRPHFFSLFAVLFPFLKPLLNKLGVNIVPTRFVTFFFDVVKKFKKDRQENARMVCLAQVAFLATI